MLTKTSSGAERNSEKGLVPNTKDISQYQSTSLPNWDNYKGLLNNAREMEAPVQAASHFNRDDFIRDIQNYLMTHQFFEELILSRPQSTDKQGQEFVIKIELKKYKLNAEFEKEIYSDAFLKTHPTLHDPARRLAFIERKLEHTLTRIAKIYTNTQKNIVDERTGVHKFENFEYWLSQKLASMTTQYQIAQQEKKLDSFNQKFMFFVVNAEGFSTVNDNFGLEVGHQFLKIMGQGLMEFRKALTITHGLPYDAVGVHRLGGPNFIVSIYFGKEKVTAAEESAHQNNQVIPSRTELTQLLRETLLKQSYQLEWNWEKNKDIIDILDLKQIKQMVRSLINNNYKDKKHLVNFGLIDRKKKGVDLIYRGNPMNIGVVDVGPNLFTNSRLLAEFLDKCVRPVNNLKNSQEILDINQPEIMKMIMNELGGEEFSKVYQYFWFRDTPEKVDHLRKQIRSQRSPSQFDRILHLQKQVNFKVSLSKVYQVLMNDTQSLALDQKSKIDFCDLDFLIKNEKLRGLFGTYQPYYRIPETYEYYFPVIDSRANPLFFYRVQFDEEPTQPTLERLMEITFEHNYFVINYLLNAHIDSLTGIPNDRALEYDLKKLLETGGALGSQDFRCLSAFTNTFGKAAGDFVLKKVVKEMNEVCEKRGVTLYRDGSRSDEFYLISAYSDEDNKIRMYQVLNEIKLKMTQWPSEKSWFIPVSLNDIYQKLDEQEKKYADFKYDREWLRKEYLKNIEFEGDGNHFDFNHAYPLNILEMPRFYHKKLYFVKWFGVSAAFTGVKPRLHEPTEQIKKVANRHQGHAKSRLELAEKEQMKEKGPFVVALSSDIQSRETVRPK